MFIVAGLIGAVFLVYRNGTLSETIPPFIAILIPVSAYLALSATALFAGSGDEELMKRAKEVLGPLPASMPSDENPITPEKVKLGNTLFWEPRISIDGTVSCARCHPFGLYAADGLKKSIGNNCKINPRNAPTVLNAAAQISAHWIGNRTDVEDQAKQAVIGPPSFGMPSYEAVEKKLKEIRGYTELFKKAFPEDARWISDVTDRIVDLLEPFRSFHFYAPEQHGSVSLKAVLPAFTGRGYTGLKIQNGTTASLEFMRIAFSDVSEEERRRIRRHLEDYCGLDTSGMVGIVEALRRLVAGGST